MLVVKMFQELCLVPYNFSKKIIFQTKQFLTLAVLICDAQPNKWPPKKWFSIQRKNSFSFVKKNKPLIEKNCASLKEPIFYLKKDFLYLLVETNFSNENNFLQLSEKQWISYTCLKKCSLKLWLKRQMASFYMRFEYWRNHLKAFINIS